MMMMMKCDATETVRLPCVECERHESQFQQL